MPGGRPRAGETTAGPREADRALTAGPAPGPRPDPAPRAARPDGRTETASGDRGRRAGADTLPHVRAEPYRRRWIPAGGSGRPSRSAGALPLALRRMGAGPCAPRCRCAGAGGPHPPPSPPSAGAPAGPPAAVGTRDPGHRPPPAGCSGSHLPSGPPAPVAWYPRVDAWKRPRVHASSHPRALPTPDPGGPPIPRRGRRPGRLGKVPPPGRPPFPCGPRGRGDARPPPGTARTTRPVRAEAGSALRTPAIRRVGPRPRRCGPHTRGSASSARRRSLSSSSWSRSAPAK